MAKNDLTLLDSILDEYISNSNPSPKPDEVFEFFATEQVLKDFAFTKEELLSGSVDGRNDGGVDEFYIIGISVFISTVCSITVAKVRKEFDIDFEYY